MPDSNSDQNSSVGSHKFNLNLYPIIIWLENREKQNKVGEFETTYRFPILDICLHVMMLFIDICFSGTWEQMDKSNMKVRETYYTQAENNHDLIFGSVTSFLKPSCS